MSLLGQGNPQARNRPLRVAFVTHGDLGQDLRDPDQWTNPQLVTRFIASAIEREGAQVRYVAGSADISELRWAYRLHKYYRKVRKQKYLIEHHPSALRSIARNVAEQLDAAPADVVFSPSTIPIAHLETDTPIVFWTDATFAGMVDYYPHYTGLCRRSIRQGHAVEQAALSRVSRAIYTSQWAADTAEQAYDFDHRKLGVLSRAPNLEKDPTPDEVNAWIQARPRDQIELLFVGNDAHRKGGDIAIQVAKHLHENGLPVRLRLLGQDIKDRSGTMPDYIEPIGFISKATAKGRDQFNHIMATSHLLLLPTRAECLSIVPLEASAFGVPTIGSRTGGTPGAIEPGISGHLFAPDTPPQQWADWIQALFADGQQYEALAHSSYNRYATDYNWQKIGRQLYEILEEAASTTTQGDRN